MLISAKLCVLYMLLVFRVLCEHQIPDKIKSRQYKKDIDNKDSSSTTDNSQHEVWNMCTKKAPEDALLWPTVGNGHVATVVHSQRVFMNGLYNGHGIESKRARIPAYTSILINEQDLNYTSKTYCLHMDKGLFVEQYVADHWSLDVTWYAHRTIPSLLVTLIHIQTDGQQTAFNINIDVNQGGDAEGINLTESTSEITNAHYVYGKTKIPETNDSGHSPVHIYYTDIPTHIAIPTGVKENRMVRILASVSPFKEIAMDHYRLGMSLQTESETKHIQRWKKIWENGRIDIFGNRDLASAAYSALYYITSSMPVDEVDIRWPFIGLSPGDLAHGPTEEEYKGHVFWDQDTWMFPPVLTLHADLGKTLIQTRIRTLDAAFEIAKQWGNKGARYPWESAFTGFETCPGPVYSEYEIHVTGDVAMAVRQYLMMTHDTELLLTGRLKEEIIGIADFWKSRAIYNPDRRMYEIHDVMPPDEWNYPVNNSVYTNAVAKLSLLLPKYALGLMRENVSPEYEAVAKKMYIPLDTNLQYHPEFDGFTEEIEVKQADAILLGFPLQLSMTEQQRRNDLIIYANMTPSGPAMTWSMFSIGWLELNDLKMANETFHRQLLNKQEPFNVWSEYSDGGGAKNFITGQGGYLQSILFGYGGLRIHKNNITLDCKHIPGTSGFRIKDLDYLGNSIDITCYVNHIIIALRKDSVPLMVKLASKKQQYFLYRNKTLVLDRQPVAIMVASKSRSTTGSMGFVNGIKNILSCVWKIINNIVVN